MLKRTNQNSMQVLSKSLSRKKYNLLMESLQKKHELKVRTKVRQWLEFVSKEIGKGINREMIRKDQADSIVIELTDWAATEKRGILTIKPAILMAIAESGQAGYKSAGITYAFDMLHPAAVELAQTITADLVREVTEETKEGIRWAIRDGVNKGKSMPQVGKRIKPLVGLTQKQVISVASFEEKLLIDKPGWKREQIDRKVASYEKKLHRKRALTISRTETSKTISEASLMAFDEAGVGAEWLTRGPLACEICSTNEGEIFSIAEARGRIPAHPN